MSGKNNIPNAMISAGLGVLTPSVANLGFSLFEQLNPSNHCNEEEKVFEKFSHMHFYLFGSAVVLIVMGMLCKKINDLHCLNSSPAITDSPEKIKLIGHSDIEKQPLESQKFSEKIIWYGLSAGLGLFAASAASVFEYTQVDKDIEHNDSDSNHECEAFKKHLDIYMLMNAGFTVLGLLLIVVSLVIQCCTKPCSKHDDEEAIKTLSIN